MFVSWPRTKDKDKDGGMVHGWFGRSDPDQEHLIRHGRSCQMMTEMSLANFAENTNWNYSG